MGTGYIQRLVDIFRNRNPNSSKIHLTGNALSVQARSIIARNVIKPPAKLNAIKQKAEDSINSSHTSSSQNNPNHTHRITHSPPSTTRSSPSTTHSSPSTTHSPPSTIRSSPSPTYSSPSTTHSPPSTTRSPSTCHSSSNIRTSPNTRQPSQNERITTRSQSRASSITESTAEPTVGEDRRRKWTDSEMEELAYCYFKARSEGPGYMNRLQTLFIQRNPNNPKVNRFNGQSLSTQARTIIKNKAISQEVLNQIQRSAEGNTVNIEITQTESRDENTPHTLPIIQGQTQSYTNEDFETIDRATQNIVTNDPLITQFLNILSETKEIPVGDRELLPKAKFNKQFIENCHKLNLYLPNLLQIYTSLRDVNDILYAAAKTLIVANNQKPFTPSNTVKINRTPAWKKRIQRKIDKFRKQLGQLIEIERGVRSRRMLGIRETLYRQYNIQNNNDHSNTAEMLKQKVKALAGRIKRYEDINAKRDQNRIFLENQHKFYRSLGHNSNNSDIKLPTRDNVQQFWSSILSNPINYNKEARWIEEVENTNQQIEPIRTTEITVDQVKIAIANLQNWKTPGIDKLQNYYLKYFKSTHKYLAALFTDIVQGKQNLEEWFTTGQVILIPKNNDTENPKNWRPIACLPSMYKLLTSVLANLLYTHCSDNNIVSIEQRGCRRGARGCKDHLMVNKAILEDAHQSQKNLSMAWIDYQKAFDSISHEWLLKILDIYRCPPMIRNFLEMTMPSWRVIMTARGTQDSITTEPISIKRGIFQGDSLSPLLFCLAINPISHILNKYEFKGFKLKDSFWINHLLYMDDLKLYANSRANLKVLLDSVEVFTNDIGMRFGLDKCNTLHLNLGHISSTSGEGHVLSSGETFNQLEIGNTYKYLGIHESGKINHNTIRQETTKEYFKRVKKLLNTHLNSRNIIKGINTYAIPVLLYSFGVINYKNNDLKKIDTKTRKLLAMNKAHQQKAEVERLYLPVTHAGRGLIKVENIYKEQILKYKQYLLAKQDHLIEAIVRHDRNRTKYSIIQEAEAIETELQLEHSNIHTEQEIKEAIIKQQNQRWRNKPLHGQFPNKVLDSAVINIKDSFNWFKKQQVSPSMESSIFAIQDQAVMTRQHQRDILKAPIDGKCRLCATKDETAQHIISGCEKLAGTYYVKRHNNLVQYVYWCLARKHNIEVDKLWWRETLAQPKVVENHQAKIMWEIPIQTDVTVTHNRPDLIYTNKVNNTTYLIDVTVPTDYNIGAKEIEKLSKYHLLKTEIRRLWGTQTYVIPIVIGATGVIAKNLKTYTDKLDSNIDVTILQKQASIHSSIIISKVLGDSVFVHGATTEPSLP